MLSRREFVAIPAMAAAAALTGVAQARLTAGQVVERIKQNLGVPWRDRPVQEPERPDTPITGIATTVIVHLCRRDQESGGGEEEHGDHPRADVLDGKRQHCGLRERMPMYQQKLQFIRDNNIVVWRCPRQSARPSAGHDLCRIGPGDGWEKYHE